MNTWIPSSTLNILTVNTLQPVPLVLVVEAGMICWQGHMKVTSVRTVTASRHMWRHNTTLYVRSELSLKQMEAAGLAACRVNVWLLGGKTQLRCSEGSSSASLWGRSSWAASRCPESQTHSCFHRHLHTETHSVNLLHVDPVMDFTVGQFPWDPVLDYSRK